MGDPAERPARRRVAVDTAALGASTIVYGLLAYVFFVLATRTLGAERAAPVAVLWSYWSAAAAALTFPLQHWIVRVLTAEGEGKVRRTLPTVAVVITALSLAAALAAWLLRGQLFESESFANPLGAGLITATCGFSGVVRGALAGRGRYVQTAVLLSAENLARCTGAVIGAAADLGSGWFVLVLALGPLVGLAWPGALRFGRDEHDPTAGESALAFLGGIAGGSLVAQLVLTAGPVMLAFAGGAPAEVTALFSLLALFRLPYQMALGMLTQATGALTTWVVERRHDRLRLVRLVTVSVSSVGVAAGAAFGAAAGPAIVRAVYGSDVVVSGRVAALVAAASVLALGNLVFTLVLTAWAEARLLLVGWFAAFAVQVVMLSVGALEPLDRVVVGFAVAEAIAFVMLVSAEARLHATAARPRLPARTRRVS